MKARVCSSRSFAHRYALSSTDPLVRNAFKRVGIKKTLTSW